MSELGKVLVGFGLLLAVMGVALILIGRGTHLPAGGGLGRLPGDIFYRGKRTTFYFPLTSSILLSIGLSVLLYLIARWRR